MGRNSNWLQGNRKEYECKIHSRSSSPIRMHKPAIGDLQQRKFFYAMKAQKNHYVSAAAIVIETAQQRFTKRQTGLYTMRDMYSSLHVHHSTSSWVYRYTSYCRLVWKRIQKVTKERVVLYVKTINFANITGSLAFAVTRTPSRTRSQRAAQLLQFCTDYIMRILYENCY